MVRPPLAKAGNSVADRVPHISRNIRRSELLEFEFRNGLKNLGWASPQILRAVIALGMVGR